MSSKSPTYIKNKNRKWLISYTLAHLIIFALFAGVCNPTFSDINALISKLRSPSGFMPLIVFPLVIILEGLIYSDHKAILVFLRIKNALPGHRAFTAIGPADPRIDMKKLNRLFPQGMPENPKAQNTTWYELYKKHCDKIIVYNAHKAFLLTRDLVALTAILIPFSVVAHLIWGSTGRLIWYHLLLLLGLLSLIIISARHYGRRFVANVIVEALA